MSTETPNLGLEYLDPSQSQPEVKVNDAWNKIDEAVGLGIGIAVSDGSTSPPIVRQARELKFEGATVTHETNGVARIDIDPSTGVGGSISVTDGVTTVTGVTEIAFTNGAAVFDAGGGVADVYVDPVSGGSGGGGNLTADTHPIPPDPANDEFEGLALDTAGTRFSGATAWAWSNQGSSTVNLTSGSLVLVAQPDGFTHFIWQAAPAAPWRFRLRAAVFAPLSTVGSLGGFVIYGSGSTKNYIFGPDIHDGNIRIHRFTGVGTYDSSPYASLPFGMVPGIPVYLEVENDGTTLYFRASSTGLDGTFVTLFSQALATWVTAVTNIGVMGNSNLANSAVCIDWFRREA